MDKVIITVVGKDTVGIIAKVCSYLAENRVNILDISQTIIQGFFSMIMVVNMEDSVKDFSVLAEEMEKLGDSIGVMVKAQKEEIFNRMHRI